MKTYSWHGSGGTLNDTYDVVTQITSVTTISGAPASVTVTTPVVDLGKSMKCTPRRLPLGIGNLEWRASDTPFLENAPSPSWSNPEGEYRYWQARVTWTDPTKLLERIEILPLPYPIVIFRRFREYWTIWDTSADKTIPSDDPGVLGTGNQMHMPEGIVTDSSDERVTTIR